jgi:hypothetical protein
MVQIFDVMCNRFKVHAKKKIDDDDDDDHLTSLISAHLNLLARPHMAKNAYGNSVYSGTYYTFPVFL